MVTASWWWLRRDEAVLKEWIPDPRLPLVLFALLVFAWLNGVIAHAVHHLAGVPYTLYSLHRSVLFQTALSVTWSVVALAVTVTATRLRLRSLWMAGALLLALVVVKLFLHRPGEERHHRAYRIVYRCRRLDAGHRLFLAAAAQARGE